MMGIFYRRRRSGRPARGQALIEFVLIIPVMLLVATMAIDMANMVFVTHRLTAATREGARVASESSRPMPHAPGTCNLGNCGGAAGASICCIAVNRTNLVLFNTGVEDPDVTGEWLVENVDGTSYVFLRVDAEADVDFFFPFMPAVFAQHLRGSATAYADEFIPAAG